MRQRNERNPFAAKLHADLYITFVIALHLYVI